MIPFKGKYNDSPVVFTSTKSVNSIWWNLERIFSENGLPFEKIDKEKGSIITKKKPINSIYTYEGEDGQLAEAQAWVVLKKVFNKKKEWKPTNIYGQWSIQVSQKEKGITTITVDPIVMCTYFPNTFTSLEIRGQSTGRLEELIRQSLNNTIVANQ